MYELNYTRHRLLDEHELYVHSWHGDGARFLELMRKTWVAIPHEARSAIHAFLLATTASIELPNSWRHQATAYGHVDYDFDGSSILAITVRFHPEAIEHFPTQAAQWVIAHELAHVYQKACGRLPGGEDEKENEDHADNLANKWGFTNTAYNIIMQMQNNRGLSIRDACNELRSKGLFTR